MSYSGVSVPIPLGQSGLHTDDPHSVIPVNAAVVANNITLYSGKLLKSPGSTRYNTTVLSDGIMAITDWWPTSTTQRLIAATEDGKIYRDTGDGTFNSATVLNTLEVQKIIGDAPPTGGAWSIKQGANTPTGTLAAATLTGAGAAAAVQAHIRTISGLSNVVVSGTWSTGFLVRFDGTTGNQTTLSDNTNTLSASAVTFTYSEVFQGGATLGTLTPDAHFCAGGAEQTGNPRKLFFFSSTTQAKVVAYASTASDGDGTNVMNIKAPAADWGTYYPTFGIVYQGRMVCFGNSNDRHRIYISKYTDHEDFTTTAVDGTGAASFSVFSGEGDGLVSACVYKGALLLFKRPFGVYVFNWNGGPLDAYDPPNYEISRFSDAFGIASPHAVQLALDDLMGGDNSLSVKSLKATSAFGALEAGDVFSLAKVRDHIRSNLSTTGLPYMHSCYYPEKELLYLTGRATSSSATQDRMIQINLNGQAPKISIETKDQPNCMTLRRDSNKVNRPIYGADDGYVYLMDQSARNVNNASYLAEFQTPYTDFSFMDNSLSDKIKLFDFLQLTYTSTGNFSMYVDVYVDGNFKETITFAQTNVGVLGSFTLDVSRLANLFPQQNRRPMHCSGKTVSFRIYNGNLNETFNIERMVVSFRVGGETNKSS